MILVPIYVSLGYSVHKASTLGLFLLLVIGSLGDPGLFFVLFWDCKTSCRKKTMEPRERLRQWSRAEKNSPGSVVLLIGDGSWANLHVIPFFRIILLDLLLHSCDCVILFYKLALTVGAYTACCVSFFGPHIGVK